MGSRWARATRGFPRCEGSRRWIVPTGGREDGLLGYGRCHQQKWGCVYVCMYIYICIYIIIFYHRRSLPSKILKRLRISPKNIIFRFSDEEILDVQKWGKFTKDWEIINQKWRFRGSSSHVILHSSRLESHFGESSRHGGDFKQTWSGDDNQQRWGFHQWSSRSFAQKTSKNTFPILATGMERYIWQPPKKISSPKILRNWMPKALPMTVLLPTWRLPRQVEFSIWISWRPCPRMGVDQQKYVFV